jgi:hypothetical protein
VLMRGMLVHSGHDPHRNLMSGTRMQQFVDKLVD